MPGKPFLDLYTPYRFLSAGLCIVHSSSNVGFMAVALQASPHCFTSGSATSCEAEIMTVHCNLFPRALKCQRKLGADCGASLPGRKAFLAPTSIRWNAQDSRHDIHIQTHRAAQKWDRFQKVWGLDSLFTMCTAFILS